MEEYPLLGSQPQECFSHLPTNFLGVGWRPFITGALSRVPAEGWARPQANWEPGNGRHHRQALWGIPSLGLDGLRPLPEALEGLCLECGEAGVLDEERRRESDLGQDRIGHGQQGCSSISYSELDR